VAQQGRAKGGVAREGRARSSAGLRWRNNFRGGGGGSVLGAGVYVAGHVASGLFEVNLMGLGN
jgi:hypothetical protein